ncbi:kinase-like domain-containing protein, partial [Pelagophyceae sp. CCMP2097]
QVAVMAPLHHANLVNLKGACWEDVDNMMLVLEFCSRGSLNDLLSGESEDELSWAHPLHPIALGIAQCFKYLHHEQIGEPLLHRDLKPDNVLITADLVAKVADFGESRRFDAEGAKEDGREDELAMTAVGTPMYCAPEILLFEAY